MSVWSVGFDARGSIFRTEIVHAGPSVERLWAAERLGWGPIEQGPVPFRRRRRFGDFPDALEILVEAGDVIEAIVQAQAVVDVLD